MGRKRAHVQKELTQQAWDGLSLGRPVCKVGLWLASGNLTDKQLPALVYNFPWPVREACCACAICTSNVALHSTCFSSGSREFWHMPVINQYQYPVNTPGTESLINLSDRHFTHCYNLFLEKFSTSCVTSLGEGPWKPTLGFPHVPFLLYPFTIINLSYEDASMLSPSSESLNMGVVLGTPDIAPLAITKR